MSETPQEAATPETSTSTSSAAEQARIRKERREAKIRAGGTARLNRITGLGGVQRDSTTQSTSNSNPDEIIISNHYYKPGNVNSVDKNNNFSAENTTTAAVGKDGISQMMYGLEPTNNTLPSDFNAFATGLQEVSYHNGSNIPENPMIQALQQMMGGAPGEGAGELPSFPGLSNQEKITTTVSPYAHIWRIIHAVFAISLGLYIAVTTQFTGTKIEREHSFIIHKTVNTELLPSSSSYFYFFLTMEAILISSRRIFCKEENQMGGITGMITGFLNESHRNYVKIIMQYMNIWTTVSRDALVCIFVLGAFVWWKNELDS